VARLLVIDEDLSKRIRTELNRRGRTARAVRELGYGGFKDPDLLARLHELDPECVLVTSDDDMPATHAQDLARLHLTVAVIAPRNPESLLDVNQWEHEIAQRWAHKMEAQTRGSVWRYTLSGPTRWTRRRRSPVISRPRPNIP
jgi:predicted nuclease of predicted toxin-antitoxin system